MPFHLYSNVRRIYPIQIQSITFVCRRQLGDLIWLLEQEFEVVKLPHQPLYECQNLDGRDLYAGWLGCSEDKDASDCLEALSHAGLNTFEWLIVDHYGLSQIWESLILSASSKDNKINLALGPYVIGQPSLRI